MKPHRSEWIVVAGLVAAFLVFNLATFNWYPAVWCDEVSYAEPAVNSVTYGSLTTLVFNFGQPDAFPAYCPLYTLTLVPWLTVTGTTVLAVRSWNLTLMALLSFLVWIASWRLSLVRTPLARCLIVPTLHLGYAMSFAYRCSRPDILGAVSIVLLVLAFGVKKNGVRHVAVVASGVAMVWIGLQVALFTGLAVVLAWLLLRCIKIRQILFLAAGMCLGAMSLGLFLAWKGVLSYFLAFVFGFLGKHYAQAPQLSLPDRFAKLISKTIPSLTDDFSSCVLIIGLISVLLFSRGMLSRFTKALVIYSLLLLVGAPVFLNFAGHYQFYYAYVRFGPAVLIFLAAFSEVATAEASTSSRWLKAFLLLVVAGTMAVGLPLRLGIAAMTSKLVPRSAIQSTVSNAVQPSDIVFTDDAAFFEVKRATRMVYDNWSSSNLLQMPLQGRDLTTEEKRAVNVLVIRPERRERLAEFFGGEWTPVTEPFGDTQDFSKLARLPIVGSKLAHYGTQPQTERYPLQIFRRKEE